MPSSSAIFSPIEVGHLRLKNRLVGLPVYTGYAHPGGMVSDLLINHYAGLSETGVAMVVVANAAVSANGTVSEHNIRIDRNEHIGGLSKLARAIKKGGARACLQINHAGRFAQTDQPFIPSPITQSNLAFNVASLKNFMNFFPLEKRPRLTHQFLKRFSSWGRAMTAAEREKTIADFGRAATRAMQAGFDMVEIHGAGGYLMCQFLSGFTHKTAEETSAAFRQRVSFPLAVVREIKRRVPADFPIGYRLILKEWVPFGIDLDEGIAFAELLQKEKIAYISASVATYNSMFASKVIKTMARPGYLREETAALTRALHLPTIISGRIITPKLAHRILKEGIAAMVGLGRPLRVDRQWVAKALLPQKRIKACLNCNWCLKRVVLNEGFNCRQWPKYIQEKTDLEQKLLSRNYKGLVVAADHNDLKCLKAMLPHILPAGKRLNITSPPTILILKPAAGSGGIHRQADAFFTNTRQILEQRGFAEAAFDQVVSETLGAYDQQVLMEADKGRHGLLIIPRRPEQPWRNKVAYKARGKIVVFIGTDLVFKKALVPIDFSISSLLTLMFLKQAYMQQLDIELHYIHLRSTARRTIFHRWEGMKKIVGIAPETPLEIIHTQGDTATELLRFIKAGGFDTVIMGRRGISRIKQWVLGSVSAGILRGVTRETLFLID